MAPKTRRDFRIAIICALPVEFDAVQAVFDEHHDVNSFGRESGDTNAYSLGSIGPHPVVLVHMPGTGKSYAATVAARLTISFPDITLALVAGICGGVPFSGREEIILGDIILSDGIVQHDFGRQLPKQFVRKNTIRDQPGRPNVEIQSLLARYRSCRNRALLQTSIVKHLLVIHQKLGETSIYPGADNDKLYSASYIHKHYDNHSTTCSECTQTPESVCEAALGTNCADLGCNEDNLIPRQRLFITSDVGPVQPRVHIGLMASGDTVVKSGTHRDFIAQKEQVIAFEMESSGIWDSLPCLVIKGVCDYSDSHKNKIWQPYASASAAACMKALLLDLNPRKMDLEGPNRELPRFGQPIFLVPFTRDTNFVGRENLMQNIVAQVDETRHAFLAGLGGIGKSQIAIEFCYRFHSDYPNSYVLWIHSSSLQRIEQGFRNVARKMHLPGSDDPKVDTIELVTNWLLTNDRKWLLVIDNLDDLEIFTRGQEKQSQHHMSAFLQDLLRCFNGSILITSRDERIGRRLFGMKPIAVGRMSGSEARELLKQSLEQEGLDAKDLNTLTETLDFIPLAIKTATAYINETKVPISRYLRVFRSKDSQATELLKHMGHDERRDAESMSSIIRTWIVSFEKLQTQNPQAADLLSLMSMFDQHGIPELLLNHSKSDTEPETETSFLAATNALRSFSLITTQYQSKTTETLYAIHRLIRISVHEWLTANSKIEEIKKRALARISDHFPKPKYENLDICSRILPHALTFLQGSIEVEEDALAFLHENLGQYYELRGQFACSFQHHRSAFELLTRLYGLEDRRTLSSLWFVGSTLEALGRDEAAAEAWSKCFEGERKVLGLKHFQTMTTLRKLEYALRNQGKFEAADKAFEECSGIAVWNDAIMNSTSIDEMELLALTLSLQDNYEAAEDLCRKIIDRLRTQVDSDDLRLLRIMEILGRVLLIHQRFEEAEDVLAEYTELCMKCMEGDHPLTADGFYMLSYALQAQKKLEEANHAIKKSIVQSEKSQGAHHPETLQYLHDFGSILLYQGQYVEAEQVFQKCFEQQESTLGAEHPDSLLSLQSLGEVLLCQHKYEAAEEAYQDCFRKRAKVFGSGHPDTLESLCDLGNALAVQEKHEAAKEVLWECLEAEKRVLGLKHPSTWRTALILGTVFLKQQAFDKAEQLVEEAFTMLQEVQGPTHSDTLWSQKFLDQIREAKRMAGNGKLPSSLCEAGNAILEDSSDDDSGGVDLNLSELHI